MAAPKLTRADIIRYAKADLDEDGDTFWSTTDLQDYANRANRTVYRELLKVNAGFFLTSTQVDWPAGAVSMDLTAAGLNDEPQLILDIEETPTTGAIGQNNLPRILVPMRFTERPMQYTSHWRSSGLISQYAWELQGNTLFIARIPSGGLNLHIHWVEQLAPMTNDADVVLNSFAQPYHDAVACCMAYLMNVKQEGENPEVSKKWAQWKTDIMAMASRRRADGPKHITITRRH